VAISPDDWPDPLPEVVRGAVRRTPLVNGDPFLSGDTGGGQD